ncbi:hypothetical protein SKAU_G00195910 [Synaphobranchus kaupii]|uniref:RRM domain-containing protein n=1 Tax=Synaphobranchus kaupii TaxID=118154 RepID=A0A9Q1IVN3_SYNKA|nr:hypothetical protein SKAU_G00195910 [Synaphobranchus kaupii]
MVKQFKVPSRALAKKKASPAEAAKSGNREETEEENGKGFCSKQIWDKLEDETSLPPQEGTVSLAKGKAAPPKETAPVEVEESEEVEEDNNEAVNEEESEPPSKVTAEMTTPTEDDDDKEADGEEEMDTAPAPDAKAKKGGMVKPKEDLADDEKDDDAASGDDDDDDDEDEEVESCEDEPALNPGKWKAKAKSKKEAPPVKKAKSEDKEPALTPGKRKAKAKSKKEAPPVKKAKSEDKGFCLFVGNLNKSKSFMEIKEALEKFFQENDLKIQNVRVGSSKKFGYVNFSTEEQLQKALMLNGKKVMDQKLRLDKAKIKETPQEAKKGQIKTLFIKGLSEKTTDDTLRETFEGAIAARIATDKETRSSKGFGFVDFDSAESCKMAKESMKYCEIDGNKVTLDFTRPKGEGRQRGAGARNREFKGRGGGSLKGKPQKKKKEV